MRPRGNKPEPRHRRLESAVRGGSSHPPSPLRSEGPWGPSPALRGRPSPSAAGSPANPSPSSLSFQSLHLLLPPAPPRPPPHPGPLGQVSPRQDTAPAAAPEETHIPSLALHLRLTTWLLHREGPDRRAGPSRDLADGLRRGTWVPRGWGTLEKQSSDGEAPRRTATAPTPGGRKVKGRRGQEQSLADATADLPAEGAQRGRAHLADHSVPVSLRLHPGGSQLSREPRPSGAEDKWGTSSPSPGPLTAPDPRGFLRLHGPPQLCPDVLSPGCRNPAPRSLCSPR